MEFVMFVSMLLFTGFCTLILVLAMLHVNRKERSDCGATQPPATDERDSGAKAGLPVRPNRGNGVSLPAVTQEER